MDPITTALIAGLSAGLGAGLKDASKKLIADAYAALKARLTEKLGADSEVAGALAQLEKKPDSKGRQQTLAEEVATSKAAEDADLKGTAEKLLELLRAQPGGEQRLQQIASGSYIAQAAGGSTASVNISGIAKPDND